MGSSVVSSTSNVVFADRFQANVMSQLDLLTKTANFDQWLHLVVDDFDFDEEKKLMSAIYGFFIQNLPNNIIELPKASQLSKVVEFGDENDKKIGLKHMQCGKCFLEHVSKTTLDTELILKFVSFISYKMVGQTLKKCGSIFVDPTSMDTSQLRKVQLYQLFVKWFLYKGMIVNECELDILKLILTSESFMVHFCVSDLLMDIIYRNRYIPDSILIQLLFRSIDIKFINGTNQEKRIQFFILTTEIDEESGPLFNTYYSHVSRFVNDQKFSLSVINMLNNVCDNFELYFKRFIGTKYEGLICEDIIAPLSVNVCPHIKANRVDFIKLKSNFFQWCSLLIGFIFQKVGSNQIFLDGINHLSKFVSSQLEYCENIKSLHPYLNEIYHHVISLSSVKAGHHRSNRIQFNLPYSVTYEDF